MQHCSRQGEVSLAKDKDKQRFRSGSCEATRPSLSAFGGFSSGPTSSMCQASGVGSRWRPIYVSASAVSCRHCLSGPLFLHCHWRKAHYQRAASAAAACGNSCGLRLPNLSQIESTGRALQSRKREKRSDRSRGERRCFSHATSSGRVPGKEEETDLTRIQSIPYARDSAQ
jgi:hypothetical protein